MLMVWCVSLPGSKRGFKYAVSHAELAIKMVLSSLELEWPVVALQEAWALGGSVVTARHEALAAPAWVFHLWSHYIMTNISCPCSAPGAGALRLHPLLRTKLGYAAVLCDHPLLREQNLTENGTGGQGLKPPTSRNFTGPTGQTCSAGRHRSCPMLHSTVLRPSNRVHN